ncbi:MULTISPECIES: LysR family transcriptional regulator [unclassified Pseudomonas]|uniref:LysR family transcriptional regulator n=1 Tax=unclassified Pseudomonas TaxID=196821 RepID=UPI001F261136|nr:MULTISPECIES: LysR family transcriptional regulator [unclassified Pseudomonas]MCF5233804.1 LysR family transcriptional regulator [Pseudomonas sp. PA-5-4H]MCF5235910.1 LysR family transcriptional regulator [Pseudomonas sp. PA-5-4G]MCF5251317.1 LysR family transcriptional regulator [Pseudomonas sp. PA-5-4B]MCF5257490.1 LysR family transcriptional regulator [Pseudomonas sp. PA-5-4B]MCF5261220.1 LysR family transcriptional regulator [Pseudomonas sp. PA-5-4A]
MISTRQLRYFVEIADGGSFSAAAERLFVAQSALSRQIKALETQLQTSLFERTARQPRLTAAGEAFYPRARNLLSELLKASEMATLVGKGQLGTLRLSHSSTVPMSGPLLHGISTWLQRCPGVSMDIVKLSSEAQLEEIADGRLEVGLLRLPVLRQREGVRVVPLYSEQLVLAVPPNHPLAGSDTPVELAQLKDEAFISVPHPQRGGLSYLSAELCMRAGFFPKAARVMSRKTTQLQLIQAGFGIALLPKSMQDIAPANLHFLSLADPDCLSTVALACTQAPSALVEQFCQTLHECL